MLEDPVAYTDDEGHRFSGKRIIGVLRAHQTGLSALDLSRKRGVGDAMGCKWRGNIGRLDVLDAWKLNVPEAENAKLKNLPTIGVS